MNDLHMELKVCEGCGALWLRAKNTSGVYCRRCTGALAEFPTAKGRRTARSRTGQNPAAGAASPARGEHAVAIAGGVR